MKNFFVIVIFLSGSFLGGCSHLTETAKAFWGSSTRALEKARERAVTKTYRCSFEECLESVLELTRLEEVDYVYVEDETDETGAAEPVKKRQLDLFLVDRKRKHMVVMGVPGNIDTTEVGIFFVPNGEDLRIEISSLSSSARDSASEVVFAKLNQSYREVK